MDNLLEQSKKYFSDVRLYRYIETVDHVEKSVDLYLLNAEVSEQAMGLISIFEIIFRNKTHMVLQELNYLEEQTAVLLNGDYKEINKIKRKLQSRKPVKNIEGRLISNLTLGFWCNLYSNNKLWCKSLHQVFTEESRKQNRINHRVIRKVLSQILTTRNMIAHHERIIFKSSFDLDRNISTIKNSILWMIEAEDNMFYQRIKYEIENKEQKILSLLNYN